MGFLIAHLALISNGMRHGAEISLHKVVKWLYVLLVVQILSNLAVGIYYYAVGHFSSIIGICLILLEIFSIFIFKKIKAEVGDKKTEDGLVQHNRGFQNTFG